MVGRSTRVHDEYPLRLAFCDLQICSVHTGEERAVLAFKSVFVGTIGRDLTFIAPASPLHAGGYIRIHQNCQVRFYASAEYAMQFERWQAPEFAAPALVRFTGIGEAITEHCLTCR